MCLYGIHQLADGMRAVRRNTLQIANDVPESHYHSRATPETRSVAETLVHIAWLASFDRMVHDEARLHTLAGFDFGAAIAQSRAEEARPRTKAAIIEFLRAEGDRSAAWAEQLPEKVLAENVGMPGGGSMNRFEMLLGTKEHEQHHQAQLTVNERLVGVVPHFTRNNGRVSQPPARV